MQLSFLSAFLALGGIAFCVPHDSLEPRHIETVMYKRGESLDTRGLELAELHGVDVSESKDYFHTPPFLLAQI
ncbi:hypothetical protein B0I35DRAFT_436087 [Stachybotrys elegans]|uniref:Peptidase S53 activation domain-containing protein n=1 Tax=Stachybotrys elegans TaxID=80388 RepID=A0A8K0SSG5_9HYPO|nr:hypothetical protein B0I35DRAFT_436087 [Stachybotrys elegans]